MQVILPLGTQADQRSGKNPSNGIEEEGRHAEGVTGEAVVVRKAPDLEVVRKDLQVSTALMSYLAGTKAVLYAFLSLKAPTRDVLLSCKNDAQTQGAW